MADDQGKRSSIERVIQTIKGRLQSGEQASSTPSLQEDKHSMSRREFLKVLGLGAGATYATVNGVSLLPYERVTSNIPVTGTATGDGADEVIQINYNDLSSVNEVYNSSDDVFTLDSSQAYEGDQSIHGYIDQGNSWGTNANYIFSSHGYESQTEIWGRIHFRLAEDWVMNDQGDGTDTCRIWNIALSDGPRNSGVNGAPTGTDGWSNRVYVTPQGDGTSPSGPFNLLSYTYHMDQSGSSGQEDIIDNVGIEPGTWYQFDYYCRANTVDNGSANDDGVVMYWLDGEQIYNRDSFRFTTDRSGNIIDSTGPVLHYGGSETAPKRLNIWYDNHTIALGGIPESGAGTDGGNADSGGISPSEADITLSPSDSIQDAINSASAGDTIVLEGGTYNVDSAIRIEKSGSSDNRITLAGASGEDVIIEFPGSNSGGHSASDQGGIQLQEASYWTIQNIIVQQSPFMGIYIRAGNNNHIEGVETKNNYLSGIKIVEGGTNNIIDNCISHGNHDPGKGGENADGIACSGSNDNTIRYCSIYNNSDDGIDLWGSYDCTVEHCRAWDNGYDSNGNGVGFKLGSDSAGSHTIRRNVSFNNKVGFAFNQAEEPMDVFNNTAYSNTQSNFRFRNSHVLRNNISYEGGENLSGVDDSSNSWNEGISDPQFVSTDPESDDFLRLSKGSSAIDAGASVGSIEYEGEAPDLGAFEQGMSSEVGSNGSGTSYEESRSGSGESGSSGTGSAGSGTGSSDGTGTGGSSSDVCGDIPVGAESGSGSSGGTSGGSGGGSGGTSGVNSGGRAGSPDDVSGSMGDQEYETIEASGQTIRIEDGETWENKLIDLGNGNDIDIIATGTNWTIRNIGVTGTWHHNTHDYVFNVSDEGGGNSVVENVYVGEGDPNASASERGGCFWVPTEHSGKLTLRNVNFNIEGALGIYGHTPGAGNGGGGTVHIVDSYAYDCHHTAYRIADNGSSITNCVAYKSGDRAANRGCWIFEGHGGGANLENVHIITNGVGSGIDTDGNPELNMTEVYTDDGSGTHSNPDHFIPKGVPLTPKQAASGGGT